MRLTLVLFPLVTAVTMFLIRPLVFCRLSAKLSHPFPVIEESPEVQESRSQPAVPLPCSRAGISSVCAVAAPLWALGYGPAQVVMLTCPPPTPP